VLPVRRSVLKVEGDRTRGEEGRWEEIIPLDDYLRITEPPFRMSPGMMAGTAFRGRHESFFRSAERMPRKSVPTRITDRLIEEVTYYVGKRVYEGDSRRVRPIERNMDRIPDKPEKGGIQYIMVEGSTVNTLQKDEKGSTWKGNRLGMVFTSEDPRTRKDGMDILKKEYVSYIGPAEEFKKYLFECAVRDGYGRYEQTVIVSDGAAWIRNKGEELFPDAVQTLDFNHPAENLYGIGKHLFEGDEKRYVPCAEGLIGLMRESGTVEVLKRLEGYKERKPPAGIVNPYTYIQHNRGKVDYAEYKRLGNSIGSGPIGSANKTVVRKRCGQAGMMWKERNARYMLTLKSREESGLWGSSVHNFISAA
jgi:hypothetical protein